MNLPSKIADHSRGGESYGAKTPAVEGKAAKGLRRMVENVGSK